MPYAAEQLICDLAISSSHAVAKGVVTPRAAAYCYCHTPMRYAWDMKEITFERPVFAYR